MCCSTCISKSSKSPGLLLRRYCMANTSQFLQNEDVVESCNVHTECIV